jgi:hypothetical protein
MTVEVADAHADVQRLLSVVKMATVLEKCTIEGQRSVMHILWAKGPNAKDIHKEIFPVYGGKCLSRKWFTTGSRCSLKDVRKSQIMTYQVALLRLRQKQLCSGWKS